MAKLRVDEEVKDPAQMNMDELLNAYEDDLGIDQTTADIDDESLGRMAQDVNLLKQVSEQQMDLALKKEQSLTHGESIDNFMPTEQAINAMQSIEDQKNRAIAAIAKNDPQYAEKKKQIEAQAKQTKYKAMKNLNANNEKVSSDVKARMRRRSIQQPAQ